MIDLDKLGPGSIVESYSGAMYTMDSYGEWWKLSISLGSSPVKNLDHIKSGTVLRAVEKGPLDDFVKGDIISFMTSGGVRVAVKTCEYSWKIVGAVSEFTSEEIAGFAVDGSVRKVGSLDGEG